MWRQQLFTEHVDRYTVAVHWCIFVKRLCFQHRWSHVTHAFNIHRELSWHNPELELSTQSATLSSCSGTGSQWQAPNQPQHHIYAHMPETHDAHDYTSVTWESDIIPDVCIEHVLEQLHISQLRTLVLQPSIVPNIGIRVDTWLDV